jgi:hypothetical protein
MSQNTNKLTSMIKQAPGQVEGLLDNVNALTDEIESITEQRNAFQNGVCGGTKASAIDLLENTILVDKGGDYVLYGPTFGLIQFTPPGNLTDWAIIKMIGIVPTPIYTYTSGDYPELDQWVDDYAFGNDYITKPLTDGATYGFNANISTLSDGRSILQNNAAKVNASMDVMSRYAT